MNILRELTHFPMSPSPDELDWNLGSRAALVRARVPSAHVSSEGATTHFASAAQDNETNFGCFGLDFEHRRFALGTLQRENQFRAALSLADVGTFGNLKPRERSY
jgi:hypothetical protein